MLNSVSQLKLVICQPQSIHKLFATAMLLFAIVYPSSFVQAANNAFGQENSELGVNTVDSGTQPLVIAQRPYRRSQVRRTITVGPARRVRVRRGYVVPARRVRVRRAYAPVRRYNRSRVRRVNRPVRVYRY